MSKFNICILILLWLAVFVYGSSGGEKNVILTNSQFDVPQSGWATYSGMPFVQANIDGRKCARIDGGIKPSELLAVCGTRMFRLNAQAKADPNELVEIMVNFFNLDGQWLDREKISLAKATSQNWQEVDKTFASPPSNMANYFTVEFAGKGYVDDVRVTQVDSSSVKKRDGKATSSTKQSINLAFDKNLKDWQPLPGNSVCRIDAKESHDGQNSLYLENAGMQTAATGRFRISPRQRYILSGWVRSPLWHSRINFYLDLYHNHDDAKPSQVIQLVTAHAGHGWSQIADRKFYITVLDDGVQFAALRFYAPGAVWISGLTLATAAAGDGPDFSMTQVDIQLIPSRDLFTKPQAVTGKVILKNMSDKPVEACYFSQLRDVDGKLCANREVIREHYGRIYPGLSVTYDIDFSDVKNLAPGRYYWSFCMEQDGKVIAKQTRMIGLMPASDEQLAKKNIRAWQRPIYFMLANGVLGETTTKRFNAWGFDVADYDLTWGDVEQREGAYDFSLIDKLVDECKAGNIGFGVRVITWNLPAWIKERGMSDKGHVGMGPPIWSKASRESLPALWGAIAKRYKNEQTVLFYAPTSGLNDGSIPCSFEFMHTVAQFYDYSPAAVEHWRKWLREKGYSLEKVGAMYGLKFNSWDDVTPPVSEKYKYHPFTGLNRSEKDRIFRLFAQFNSEGFADILTRCWESIRKEDPVTPILWKYGGSLWERDMYAIDLPRILRACKKYNVVVVDTGLPGVGYQKMSYAENFAPDLTRGGEIGAENENPPMVPERVIRGFWGAMRCRAQWLGLCFWALEPPTNEWAGLKPLLSACLGSELWNENFLVYGDMRWRSYTQEIYDYSHHGEYQKVWEVLNNNTVQYGEMFDCVPVKPGMTVLDPGTPRIDDESEKELLDNINRGGVLWTMAATNCDKPDSSILAIVKTAAQVQPGIKKVACGKGFIWQFDSAVTLSSYLKEQAHAVKWQPDVNGSAIWACVLQKNDTYRLVLLNRQDAQVTGTLHFAGKFAGCNMLSDGDGYNPQTVPAAKRDGGYELKLNASEVRSYLLVPSAATGK